MNHSNPEMEDLQLKANIGSVLNAQKDCSNQKKYEISSKIHNSKMHIESDDDDEQFMQQLNQKIQAMQKTDIKANSSKKRVPDSTQTLNSQTKQLKITSQVFPRKIKQTSYSQLPEQIIFYLTQVYQFSDNKLYITGIMQNGQSFNIVSNQTQRQLYFAFKKQQFQEESLSPQFIQKGVNEINQRLRQNKINQFFSELVQKQYVFQIDGISRSKRPYYKVRYPFSNLEVPQPDWQGDYFKYVFGTTYTPLELFILNTGVKGPCWVKIEKEHLKQNRRNIQGGLCGDIDFAQYITPIKQKSKPPTLKAMSVSLKAIVPSQISKKSLFPTNRIDQSHIYCISYTYCDEYWVELKPPKYNSYQKTFYLKEFGKMNEVNFVQCDNEKQMIAQFLSDVYFYDPDVLICHDSARIIDVLIQRLMQINDKNDKPRIGRLIHYPNLSSTNQHSRISNAIAGRLLVDTFVHSKDMIKSIDYELQSMSKHIKPEKNFKGMSEEQVKNFLQTGKTFFVLKKVRDQAEITFSLMNHLEVLQLSRNLSVICGNLWKRSLQNQRAERNEFLIMHQCIKRDLIIPDKFKTFKNDEESQQTDKKKYAGGMVIEPKKGMYNDFIILLDFNSLYPSIIRQYNICFSKLDRPKMPLSKYYKSKKNKKDDKNKTIKQQKMQGEIATEKQKYDDNVEISPPPKELCVKQNWGFLPHLIDGIVNQRKKCKKAMKGASAQKCIILDIQQKSYKIVANSIYGCLGFSISRFYSKPMAALITRMGREALQRANDIVSVRGGVQVIYGDTDSLMIQPTNLNKETDRQKIIQIKTIADDLKKSINKEYKNLQIDIDGIFKPIILLMKKKYVANKLTNFEKIIAGIDLQPNFHLEYKGIEVVRRDGCEVARSSLKKILEILMNSKKTDPAQVYEEIYEYARDLNQSLPNLNSKQFLFSKQLNKKIKEYVNAQSIPHVKVAMDKIKNGEKEETLVNHTIYYLVTKPKLQSQDSLAKCCIDDRTFDKSQKFDDDKKYEIDFDHYKEQILQPWMRIFIHLEEFNIDKLFESFEVEDAKRKKIKKQIKNEKEQVDNGLQDFLTNDMKEKSRRFNEQMGEIICTNCKNTLTFSENGQICVKCKYCPIDNSKQMISMLSNKISFWLKQRISKYYCNKFKCDCQKVYPLTCISKCCRVQLQRKTIIPFEVHTFVYLAKQLIEITIKKGKQSEDCNKRLNRIDEDILERFLLSSDFENLNGVFSGFKL